MKKSIITLATAVAMTSCHGDRRPISTGLSAHTSPATAEVPARSTPTATDSTSTPPVTSQGIGPLRLGMSPHDLPSAVQGVYDSISISEEVWDDERFTVVECFRNSMKTVEALAISSPDRIEALTITGSGIHASAGSLRLCVGSDATQLPSQAGVHPLPPSADGAMRYEWHGLTFYTSADTVMAISIGEE